MTLLEKEKRKGKEWEGRCPNELRQNVWKREEEKGRIGGVMMIVLNQGNDVGEFVLVLCYNGDEPLGQ